MRVSWCGMLITSMLGCGGLRIADSPASRAFPPELRERQVFKTVGVYGRDLSGLVGHILYAKKTKGVCPSTYTDADLGLRQYLVPNAKLLPDNKVEKRYESKIDKNASIDASYLTFTAGLSSKQMAEVIVTDTMSMIISNSDIPVKELEAIALTPLGPEDCDRFYIRGAILTTIVYKVFNERSGKGTASGTTFGANGKVYSSDSEYSLDYKLGITVLPIRKELGSLNGLAAGSSGPKPFAALEVPENGLQSRND